MSKPPMSYDRLIAFASGELSGPEAAEVEAYVATDPKAAETVARFRMARATLRADDGADPPPEVVAKAKAIYDARHFAAAGPSLTEQVGRLVARLIYDSRLEPAVAGLRGQTTGFQVTYDLSAGGAELDLQAELAEEVGNGHRWRLVGQVASEQSLPATRVALCRAGSLTPVETTTSDERGVFVLRTEPGTFDLHLHLPAGVSVVPDIRIG